MTFAIREISLTMALAEKALNESGDSIVTLRGHRCEAIILNSGGTLNLGEMQLRIYGMKLADMNKFSTNHLLPLGVRGDSLSMSAGDSINGMKQVFDGTIVSACVNYQGMPDIAFDVNVRPGFLHQLKPAAANSYEGDTDVASIVEALAKQMGYAFKNNGVSVKLSNPNLPGTLIQQLQDVTEAARILCKIENGTVTIWPNGTGLDDGPLEIGPTTGLVGYPTFTRTGIQITSEFNPGLFLGRQITVRSSVEKASGPYFVQALRHELSTVHPHGPWFTTVNLAAPGYGLNVTRT